MNTKIIFFLFIIIASFSCKSDKKQTSVFQISGNLKDFNTKTIALQSKEEGNYKTIYTAKKKNATFIISSPKILSEGIYYLQVGNDEYRIPLLIDNEDIIVYLDNLDLSKSQVDSDSKIQLTYYNFLKGSKQTNNLFAYQKRFIIENKSNILSAIVLKDMLGNTSWRLEQTQLLYDQLDQTIQSGKIGQEISQYLSNEFENTIIEKISEEIEKDVVELEIEKTEVIPAKTPIAENPVISQPLITEYAPYFYGNGLDGNEMSAKSIFAKNKLTLIDFWASWCQPCRAQNPDFVRLYNKYHSKGFEILSVAEDKEDANWRSAITQDNMTWEHINDDFKRIATMYKVSTIPHAILVNNQGGIIAKKVSSGELERLLINEFGY